jgi:ComF family protein
MTAWLPRLLAILACGAGRRCQLCATVLADPLDYPLCRHCQTLLAPRLGGFCPICGTCYADPSASIYSCLACRQTPPPWSGLVFHGPYSGVLKELVHRHKFGHDLGLGLLLGALVREAWELRGASRPDCVVPVPMFPKRVLRRGFNQSAELARMLGAVLDQKPLMGGLRKIRDTQAQSSLGRTARRSNVLGAFEASSLVRGKRVLLVDDVMTTGATLTACADACLNAGATGVNVFVLARAL